MKTKKNSMTCAFGSFLLLCLISTTSFGRILSPKQMGAIVGKAPTCCDGLTTSWCTTDGEAGGSTNGCKDCMDDAEPGALPPCDENSRKWSGYHYESCITGVANPPKLCYDNGNENCSREYDCETSDTKGKKCKESTTACDDDSTNPDHNCRECDLGTATSPWQTQPDKLCQ